MHIDWATLAAIAVVAAAAALTVVLLVSFALVGLSARSGRQVDDPRRRAPGARPAPGVAVATLCLVAAGLIVAYGLYLISPETPQGSLPRPDVLGGVPVAGGAAPGRPRPRPPTAGPARPAVAPACSATTCAGRRRG